MDRSDDARIPPTTDGQEPNTSSSSTLEAMPPLEEPTSLPTADPQPSPAQPIFPNRHLSDDERGTSSKYPEVKGDGALPPAPDFRTEQDTGVGINAHGDDHYEDTPPSSTDHPRPEHMVNAAEPDGRGVVIRAGSGFGSSVSDENSTRPPEHVSANEKASPPAQDSLEDFNRKAAEAYHASMEAVRTNPSAALDLVMLQALDKMLAGIKVHSGRAPPSSLAQYGYYPNDSLLPNRQLTEDERGTSAKYPEVKGDGAMAKTKKKATAKTTKKTATKRSLAIVMVVPPDAPFDDGMDTAISPGPWVLISSAPAPAPKPSSDNLLPSPPHRRRLARSHSQTNGRTQQSQAAKPPPDGSELGALGRPLSRAPGSTPPTTSARDRRLLGRNHLREHEHLCDEYGEQLTEEEHFAKALHESTVTSDDHACTPPVANDSAPSVTENRAHSATADAAHPNAEREVEPRRR